MNRESDFLLHTKLACGSEWGQRCWGGKKENRFRRGDQFKERGDKKSEKIRRPLRGGKKTWSLGGYEGGEMRGGRATLREVSGGRKNRIKPS